MAAEHPMSLSTNQMQNKTVYFYLILNLNSESCVSTEAVGEVVGEVVGDWLTWKMKIHLSKLFFIFTFVQEVMQKAALFL